MSPTCYEGHPRLLSRIAAQAICHLASKVTANTTNAKYAYIRDLLSAHEHSSLVYTRSNYIYCFLTIDHLLMGRKLSLIIIIENHLCLDGALIDIQHGH
jgi:hypothetical protein